MLPRTLIDTAEIPGGGTLRLIRRGEEWSIMLGANELMNSRLSGSEEALAELALERTGAAAPQVLIGGLGMGFTLRAALARLGPEGRLVVAELVPAVVDWARGPMAALFAGSLDDPRVEVAVADVADVIADAAGGYDAILLDVDNGPDGITHPGNDRLYSAAGLALARRALRPGGVLALWSSGPDAAFTRRLQRTGAAVEEVVVRAHKGRCGARHTIWLAHWSR
jgi:spermidine synthase